MKRLLLPVVLMLMLCACESAAPPVRESVAEFWQRTGSVSAEVAVRAEFDDYAVDFRMDCAYSDGRCSVTVTEPAEIGGVEILVEENGLTVEYAGSSIEAGEGGISPATVFAELVRVWKNGYISENGTEKDDGQKLISTVHSSGQYEYRTLFSAESFAPISAEIYLDGKRIISCTFEQVTFGEMSISE